MQREAARLQWLSDPTGTLDRVQLEPGTNATVFERRPPGVESSLNMRYLVPVGPTLMGAAYVSSAATFAMNYPVAMRANPSSVGVTCTAINELGIAIINTGLGTPSAQVLSTNYARWQVTSSTSMTAGAPCEASMSGLLSAEL